MKVSVNCTFTYTFEVDVPDDVRCHTWYCDETDPIFHTLCDTAMKFNNVTDCCGVTNSIVNDETGEILYED